MSWYAENMQHRIVNCKFKFAVFAGICQKKTCSWSAKKTSIKIDRVCRKNAISSSADPRTPRLLTSNMYVHVHLCNIYSAYICVYNAVTILFNQHFIIVGNTVGKSPTGILTLFICLVLKPLKLQNVWRIFRPSRVFLYCKYANMHVNCKQIFPWTINNVNICRKHATSYCKL